MRAVSLLLYVYARLSKYDYESLFKQIPKHIMEKIEKYKTRELVDSFVDLISSSRVFMYWKSKKISSDKHHYNLSTVYN